MKQKILILCIEKRLRKIVNINNITKVVKFDSSFMLNENYIRKALNRNYILPPSVQTSKLDRKTVKRFRDEIIESSSQVVGYLSCFFFPVSIFHHDATYSDSEYLSVSPIPPNRCHDCTFRKDTTASFHILSNYNLTSCHHI
jgi:hypothetical protein